MNNLSIILYLIDVLGNLQNVSIAFSIGLAIIGFMLNAIWFESYNKPYHGSICLIPIFFFLLFVSMAVAIPSKQTMQMIAVSEASEMVIMNDEVREVMSDIKDVLKTQLGKLKE